MLAVGLTVTKPPTKAGCEPTPALMLMEAALLTTHRSIAGLPDSTVV